MKELAPRQKQLYDFYTNKKNWRPPTLKQCREFLKVGSDSVVLEMLAAIKKKKYPLK